MSDEERDRLCLVRLIVGEGLASETLLELNEFTVPPETVRKLQIELGL